MKTILLIILAVVIVGILALVVGPCAYYNFIDKPGSGIDLPNETEATYSFYIENSGGLVLSSNFEQHGHTVGSRIFILQSFWELRGKDFKFIDGRIVLDENIFGEITVTKRSK